MLSCKQIHAYCTILCQHPAQAWTPENGETEESKNTDTQNHTHKHTQQEEITIM